MFHNGLARLRQRSGAAGAWRFPDTHRVWLGMLFASAVLVAGLIGYGILTFRYLDRLDLAAAEPDIPLRLARVLNEKLLRSVRSQFDARAAAYQELLESPPADVIDPAR